MKISNPSEGNVIATTDPVVIDALAAGLAGALGTVSDAGHRHGVDLSDFLVLEGEQLTEATSTSTSAIDLISLTGLTIPALTPFLIVCNFRKSAGAGNDIHLGLTINATVVGEANTDVATGVAHGGVFNEAESGVFMVVVGPREATYLRSAVSLYAIVGAATGRQNVLRVCLTADIPNAEVTGVIIRGISDDALITMAAKNLRVYTLPVA